MSNKNNNDKSTEEQSGKKEASESSESGKWSNRAKVGAAVGSAAIAAALIYAGRHQMKKHDDFAPAKGKPLPKYENEPDYDDGDDDIAAGNDEEE